jgi:hypothetical protein
MFIAQDIDRNDRGQFSPGISGNPSGRPKMDRTMTALSSSGSIVATLAFLTP